MKNLKWITLLYSIFIPLGRPPQASFRLSCYETMAELTKAEKSKGNSISGKTNDYKFLGFRKNFTDGF